MTTFNLSEKRLLKNVQFSKKNIFYHETFVRFLLFLKNLFFKHFLITFQFSLQRDHSNKWEQKKGLSIPPSPTLALPCHHLTHHLPLPPSSSFLHRCRLDINKNRFRGMHTFLQVEEVSYFLVSNTFSFKTYTQFRQYNWNLYRHITNKI